MPRPKHTLRLLSLLLAGIAWLVLASGISRALVVCTDACGAEHLTFVHAAGECCHDPCHAPACAHDAATPSEVDHDESICASDDHGACPCHHDGCEDHTLPSDAPMRPQTSTTPVVPPLVECRTPHVPEEDRCGHPAPVSTCARPPCRGGGRDLLVLRI
jgi:hypothetical protein